MIAIDLVRVCSLTDRDRADAIARDLRRAGITSIFIPSAWTIGVWDVEVAPDDVDLASAILDSAEAR
jgi:hypothetical protein